MKLLLRNYSRWKKQPYPIGYRGTSSSPFPSHFGNRVTTNKTTTNTNTTNTTTRSHRRFTTSGGGTNDSTIVKQSNPAAERRRGDIVEMSSIVERQGVRLTDAEFVRLREIVDANRDGLVSRSELTTAGRRAVEERAVREVCLSVIELPDSAATWDRWIGQYALRACDVGGTVLYAVAGTQVAGDVGMNVVGCTLVGCATALGGGTLNNLLYGTASPMRGKPGVFWVRFPEYLFMAAGASLATFFLWPWYCQQQADTYLHDMMGEKNLQTSNDGSIVVTKRVFCRTCKNNPEFLTTMRDVIGDNTTDNRKSNQNEANAKPKVVTKTPEQIFDMLDTNQSGSLDRDKLRRLTQQQFDNSWETYVVDSFALASFAVAAAHGGIRAGVHPVVAATAGVTICFGGIVRDVLCGRSIAIGAQSYAAATGAGATVYVALRELAVRGWWTNSLVARIVLTAGTTMGMRIWEHEQKRPLLAPMHGRPPVL